MFIKEEPLDEDDIKEEIFAEYRTHVKVELETDSEDSSDEDVVVTSIKEEDIKEESKIFVVFYFLFLSKSLTAFHLF